jgi:AcrR family transcriptional regulator
MKPSSRPRSTRDRPAKAPLSEEAIVDAALAILKAEGLEAVSMRRVAAALDTGAGSLYVYVDGRDGLLEAIFDRIIAAVKLETPDPSRWRTQLHNLLERVRAELVTHPGMAAATMVDPPRTEVAMRLLENLLGILLAGGLDAQDAAWAAEITANFGRLPSDDFPLITAHTAQLVAGDADERFRFAVDVMIDGVLGRASRR